MTPPDDLEAEGDVTSAGPAQELAGLLRELRTTSWPPHAITQSDVGGALNLSVPTVSSWENRRSPKSPTREALLQLATLFASKRSLAAGKLRVLQDDELDDDERAARDKLAQRFSELRARARGAVPIRDDAELADPWRFADGAPVRVICGRLAKEDTSPFGEDRAHNRIALANYADVDALVELFAYLRKVNPESNVQFRRADMLAQDDLQAHLILLGNMAWEQHVGSAFLPDDIPIKPVKDPEITDGEVFEILRDGVSERLRPEFTDDGLVTEDVGLFLRARSQLNQDRLVTICSGVYTRGGYAAVRILTDDNLRQHNLAYLAEYAKDKETYGVAMRVKTFGPIVVTPDLRDVSNRHFQFALPS